MYDLGSRIKTLRKKRGLSQKALADMINKSASAVSSYELNTQIPPLDVLVSIAYVLNTSLDYLSGLEKELIYSTKSLDRNQERIISLLFSEFSSPSSIGKELSPQQIEIIHMLLSLFYDSH